MIAKLVFKSTITTKQTYPYAVELKFALECHDINKIFDEAHEYEENIISGDIVSITTECLGYSSFSSMTNEEMKQLDEMGIKNLND